MFSILSACGCLSLVDASQSKSSVEGISSSSFPAVSTSFFDSAEYSSSHRVIDSSSNHVQPWLDVSPPQKVNEESEDTPNHHDPFTPDHQLNPDDSRKPFDMPNDSLEVPTSRPTSVVTPVYLPSSTRRNIYIRGQRMNAPDSSRSVGVRKTASRDFRNLQDVQDGESDVSNGGANETFTNTTTKRRTVITNRRRFYNFKLLHDSLQASVSILKLSFAVRSLLVFLPLSL